MFVNVSENLSSIKSSCCFTHHFHKYLSVSLDKSSKTVLTVTPRKHIQSGFSHGQTNSKIAMSVAGNASVTYLNSTYTYMHMHMHRRRLLILALGAHGLRARPQLHPGCSPCYGSGLMGSSRLQEGVRRPGTLKLKASAQMSPYFVLQRYSVVLRLYTSQLVRL